MYPVIFIDTTVVRIRDGQVANRTAVTTGQVALLHVLAADGITVEDILRFAGWLEDASEHLIAAAIAPGARQGGVTSLRL